jgi:hypothetical protein
VYLALICYRISVSSALKYTNTQSVNRTLKAIYKLTYLLKNSYLFWYLHSSEKKLCFLKENANVMGRTVFCYTIQELLNRDVVVSVATGLWSYARRVSNPGRINILLFPGESIDRGMRLTEF